MHRQYADVDGTRVKDLRGRHDWDQQRLADEAHLNIRTVQKVEAGGQNDITTVSKVAAALGLKSYKELQKDASALPEPIPVSPPASKHPSGSKSEEYRRIWKSDKTLAEKLEATTSLYNHPNAQLVALEEAIDVHIDKLGNATIEYHFHVANISDLPIMGELLRIWFERAESIEVEAIESKK